VVPAPESKPDGLPPLTPTEQKLKAGPWPQPLLEYVRMVVSLIERRKVSLEEIDQMLMKIWRQRSMARPRKLDHIVGWLNEHPP
jgi:hypothetical protein